MAYYVDKASNPEKCENCGSKVLLVEDNSLVCNKCCCEEQKNSSDTNLKSNDVYASKKNYNEQDILDFERIHKSFSRSTPWIYRS